MKKRVFHIPFLGFFTRAWTLGDIYAKTPLIILHGGPGSCDERYEPLEKLAEQGVPLIFYDQLGCGYSKVSKNHKIDWNIDVFVDELENLITFFKLKKFSVLGHSWGGMLALEYVCNRKHLGLEKLVLFSTLPSTKIWNDEHLKMIENYSKDEKEALFNEKDGKPYDKEAFKEATRKFARSYVGKRSTSLYPYKRKRFPKTNREIYEKMWGNSELFGTGNLLSWNVEEKLNLIDVPTLIISGALDESTPVINRLMNEKIKNSKWVLLKNSHHIGYAEENEVTIISIIDFIK